MDKQRDIGKFIAAARARKNMTQHDVALAIDVDSVSVSKWELGTRNISRKNAVALSRVLEVPVDDIRPGTSTEQKLRPGGSDVHDRLNRLERLVGDQIDVNRQLQEGLKRLLEEKKPRRGSA